MLFVASLALAFLAFLVFMSAKNGQTVADYVRSVMRG